MQIGSTPKIGTHLTRSIRTNRSRQQFASVICKRLADTRTPKLPYRHRRLINTQREDRGFTAISNTKFYVICRRAQGDERIKRSNYPAPPLTERYTRVIVITTLRTGSLIIAEAGLSFMSVSALASVSIWGFMIAQGQKFLSNNFGGCQSCPVWRFY